MNEENGIEILDNIPANLSLDRILERLQTAKENQALMKCLREYIDIVQPVARPKAAYRVSYIDSKSRDEVIIDGVRFESHILRVNLDKAERVFPYVATCGRELDAITVPSRDVFREYCLDCVKRAVLDAAFSFLKDYLMTRYTQVRISKMSPGSGSPEDWPISQQRELFALLGDAPGKIGVNLTGSLLMTPLKTLSGIFFPAEARFESCQLCLRENCLGRRAPFDAALLKKYRETKL